MPAHQVIELQEIADLLGGSRAYLDLQSVRAARASVEHAQARILELIRLVRATDVEQRQAVATIASAASTETRTPTGAMPAMPPIVHGDREVSA